MKYLRKKNNMATPKSKDPSSKRSKRRANRNFTASRPERRAERRLNSAMGAFQAGNGDMGYRKPGAVRHW